MFRGFEDELNKLGGPIISRAKGTARWVGKELLAPAIPTAVLAVLANEAVGGAQALKSYLFQAAEPVKKGKRKRK
jgi:hypothetical protein